MLQAETLITNRSRDRLAQLDESLQTSKAKIEQDFQMRTVGLESQKRTKLLQAAQHRQDDEKKAERTATLDQQRVVKKWIQRRERARLAEASAYAQIEEEVCAFVRCQSLLVSWFSSVRSLSVCLFSYGASQSCQTFIQNLAF